MPKTNRGMNAEYWPCIILKKIAERSMPTKAFFVRSLKICCRTPRKISSSPIAGKIQISKRLKINNPDVGIFISLPDTSWYDLSAFLSVSPIASIKLAFIILLVKSAIQITRGNKAIKIIAI